MSSYSKTKGRKDNPANFAGISRIVMKHPDYIGLGSSARSLLQEAALQHTGKNNGDITFAWAVMKKRGYKSRTTIDKAKKELLAARMIIETRKGQFTNPGGICALYALTWLPINECQGKLDIKSTITPPRKFSLEKLNDPAQKLCPLRTETVPMIVISNE